jgi:hypothetical protein
LRSLHAVLGRWATARRPPPATPRRRPDRTHPIPAPRLPSRGPNRARARAAQKVQPSRARTIPPQIAAAPRLALPRGRVHQARRCSPGGQTSSQRGERAGGRAKRVGVVRGSDSGGPARACLRACVRNKHARACAISARACAISARACAISARILACARACVRTLLQPSMKAHRIEVQRLPPLCIWRAPVARCGPSPPPAGHAPFPRVPPSDLQSEPTRVCSAD